MINICVVLIWIFWSGLKSTVKWGTATEKWAWTEIWAYRWICQETVTSVAESCPVLSHLNKTHPSNHMIRTRSKQDTQTFDSLSRLCLSTSILPAWGIASDIQVNLCSAPYRAAFARHTSRERSFLRDYNVFNVSPFVLRAMRMGQYWPEGDEVYHAQLTMPVLVLHGSQNKLVPTQDNEDMAKVSGLLPVHIIRYTHVDIIRKVFWNISMEYLNNSGFLLDVVLLNYCRCRYIQSVVILLKEQIFSNNLVSVRRL